jgi:hypothetical protein
MRDEVIRVVTEYFEGTRRNEPAGLPVHEDVVFEGPLRTYRGIAEFLKGVAEFVPLMKSIDVFV